MVVRPEAPDIVSWPTQASQPASLFPSRNRIKDWHGGTAHRFRPLSTVPRRQDFRPYEVAASFGLGTRATQRLATFRRTSTFDASDRCLLPKLSRLRAPVLVGSRCGPSGLRPKRRDGFWEPATWPGEEGDHVTLLISALACRIHPFGVLRTRGTCSFPRDRCGQPLTRLSLLPFRF